MNSSMVRPMLDALTLPEDSNHEVISGRSAILGVARHWPFQRVASFEGVWAAVDADLIGIDQLLEALNLPASSELDAAEIVARLYVRFGRDFPKKLHGSFSLALWDERLQRLILAVDKMGVRSLYWKSEASRVLFASRAGAVRAVQSSSASVNPKAVLQYLLFSSVSAPLAIDQGMERLLPGTLVSFDHQGRSEHTQYWDVSYNQVDDRSISAWASSLREGIRSSVHKHLEGCDAPQTGCYLSGGTDSSSVLAFVMEKHSPAQSFSIAFKEAGFSEIEFARTAAQRFGSRHYEKWLAPDDASKALDKLISYYDEPFANSSAIGSYYCALMAREKGVTTLLAGDGGDELFGGNERYAHDKKFALYHRLPAWVRKGFVEPIVGLLPQGESKLSLPAKYIRRANIPNPRRILSYGFFLNFLPSEVFDHAFLREIDEEGWLAIPEMHFQRPDTDSELNRILYLDAKMTLADNDLRKVSGTAELAGVNVRYPLLDDRLVDFAGTIPPSLKLRGFQKRYIFKRAMKGILPDKILYKKKHGFGVPLAQWLLCEPRMRELLQDLMHDSRTRQRGYFRPVFFDLLLDLHEKHPNYYGEIVWYLLALELWHRKHFDRSRDTVHAA